MVVLPGLADVPLFEGLSLLSVLLSSGLMILAHCDTTGGPLIPEAKAALEKGDVTGVLKWVRPQDEPLIRGVFGQAVVVRSGGAEAKDLADRHFIETLVRIHRAGEGAPFTGVSDKPVEPIVALADKALDAGSAAGVVEKLAGHLGKAVEERFRKAVLARAHRDESVEAGREYVAAYVDYVHYVEAVHAAMAGAGGHHHAD